MQNVEVMGSIIWEKSCDQRVGNGFQSPVSDSEQECTPEKVVVCGFFSHAIGCAKSDKSGDNMKKKGSDHQLAIANFVDNHTADDDTEAESCEACATYFA